MQSFPEWCAAKLGSLSADQSQCHVELTHRFGRRPHDAEWNTSIFVAPHDSLSVISEGAPRALIGGSEGPELEKHATFFSDREGILAFRSAEGKKFSVVSVKIKRCFEAGGMSVRCQEAREVAADESAQPL